MINLTDNAKAASRKLNVTPVVTFEIAGISEIFTNAGISEYIRIGDPGLFIGNDWVIGGFRLINGQSVYIMFEGGNTTTKINQKISADRAQGSSVTSLVITLLDKNEEITRLISPGFALEEILGAECLIRSGFNDTAFPQDYNIIFQGMISDIDPGPGYINFLLVNSEEAKRRPLFDKSTTGLVNAIPTGPISNITVTNGALFPSPTLGPDLAYDPMIEFLCRVNDEIFRYTTGGSTLSGLTRAYLDTIESTHDIEDDARFGIRLQGNGIDIALKIMLSGVNDYFEKDLEVTHIGKIEDGTLIDNCIFFESKNVIDELGISNEDYVTVISATNGSNNFSMRQIIGYDLTPDGSYIVVDGAPLLLEADSPAKVHFRSKYDTLGIGLGMSPKTVDVPRHEYIRDTFLSNFEYDFRGIFDVNNMKDFLEKQVYLPMACFSVPRSGKSSITYMVGPIGSFNIPVVSVKNVTNPGALKPKRSIASNFVNTVQFEYDKDVIDSKYKRVTTYSSSESKLRIPIGDKLLSIKSDGLRSLNNANAITFLASQRMLERYRYGAEFVSSVRMLFKDGFPIEIGDIVLLDYSSLKLSDISSGSRSGDSKYMECINKTYDLKTGEINLDFLNTSYELTDRFGLISPSSKINTGSTTTTLFLKKSWSTKSYQKETRKWKDYIGEKILVHSPDWTYQEETTIKATGTTFDSMIVDPALSIIPSEDYIVDVAHYPDSTDPNENITWKGIYAFWSPVVSVVAGISQTVFTVSPGDFDHFFLGCRVRLNNFDFSEYSEETKVVSLNSGTYEITIDDPTGFTITSAHTVKLIGFKDEGLSYKLI